MWCDKCNFESKDSSYKYCPYCGSKLNNDKVNVQVRFLDSMIDKEYLDEDDIVNIAVNGWFYERFIGHKVIIENSKDTRYLQEYMIVDLKNKEYFELEAIDPIAERAFDDCDNNYKVSRIRKWLNNDYLDGFDNKISQVVKCMHVQYKNGKDVETLEDFVKLPSVAEISVVQWVKDCLDAEGRPCKVRPHLKSGRYWLRSTYMTCQDYVWGVELDGEINSNYRYDTTGVGVVPVFRIGKSKVKFEFYRGALST
jgi:hypothetical protein